MFMNRRQCQQSFIDNAVDETSERIIDNKTFNNNKKKKKKNDDDDYDDQGQSEGNKNYADDPIPMEGRVSFSPRDFCGGKNRKRQPIRSSSTDTNRRHDPNDNLLCKSPSIEVKNKKGYKTAHGDTHVDDATGSDDIDIEEIELVPSLSFLQSCSYPARGDIVADAEASQSFYNSNIDWAGTQNFDHRLTSSPSASISSKRSSFRSSISIPSPPSVSSLKRLSLTSINRDIFAVDLGMDVPSLHGKHNHQQKQQQQQQQHERESHEEKYETESNNTNWKAFERQRPLKLSGNGEDHIIGTTEGALEKERNTGEKESNTTCTLLDGYEYHDYFDKTATDQISHAQTSNQPLGGDGTPAGINVCSTNHKAKSENQTQLVSDKTSMQQRLPGRPTVQAQEASKGDLDNDDPIVVDQPGPYDVICGRNSAAFDSVGNRRFRLTVLMALDRYQKAGRRDEKTKIIKDVYWTLVDNVGARFLKKLGSNVYKHLTKKQIQEKIGHCFRDFSNQRSVDCVKANADVLFMGRSVVSCHHSCV